MKRLQMILETMFTFAKSNKDQWKLSLDTRVKVPSEIWLKYISDTKEMWVKAKKLQKPTKSSEQYMTEITTNNEAYIIFLSADIIYQTIDATRKEKCASP